MVRLSDYTPLTLGETMVECSIGIFSDTHSLPLSPTHLLSFLTLLSLSILLHHSIFLLLFINFPIPFFLVLLTFVTCITFLSLFYFHLRRETINTETSKCSLSINMNFPHSPISNQWYVKIGAADSRPAGWHSHSASCQSLLARREL